MATVSAALVLETQPVVAPAVVEAEARVLLHGISWNTYEQISGALIDYAGARLTYHDGRLEIMTTSYPHEMYASILGDLLKILASEMEIDCISARTTTFKLSPKELGFEGDDTFYFSYLDELRQPGKKIDLSCDPAPDLVIEVDISNPSLNKLPIFIGMNIKEFWRWYDNELTIYQLIDGSYEICSTSHFLPNATVAEINELVYEQQTVTSFEWNTMVRAYARQCMSR